MGTSARKLTQRVRTAIVGPSPPPPFPRTGSRIGSGPAKQRNVSTFPSCLTYLGYLEEIPLDALLGVDEEACEGSSGFDPTGFSVVFGGIEVVDFPIEARELPADPLEDPGELRAREHGLSHLVKCLRIVVFKPRNLRRAEEDYQPVQPRVGELEV